LSLVPKDCVLLVAMPTCTIVVPVSSLLCVTWVLVTSMVLDDERFIFWSYGRRCGVASIAVVLSAHVRVL
jgi:hypothetical protein